MCIVEVNASPTVISYTSCSIRHFLTPHTLTFSLQAVFNVTNTRYPLQEADYHHLAGIQAATFAAEHPGEGVASTRLRPFIHKFYPPHILEMPVAARKSLGKLFRQKSVEQPPAEEKLRESFESVAGKGLLPHNLKILYLQYCWSKPFYG